MTDFSPLIVFGTGRCGSTLLHDMLATHPGVSYMTEWCERWPKQPERNRLAMRLLDLPAAGGLARRKFWAVEAYRFWDRHAPGFSLPFRDLLEGDVTPLHARVLPAAVAALAAPHRPRMLLKITGWPRLGFLRTVFPAAKFVHVYRDGRATAQSLMKVKFWRGWGGPEHWGFGPLTPERAEKFERHDRSFVALAGLEWDTLMEATARARERVAPGQLLELSYEALCAQPEATLRRVAEFAELPFTPGFARGLKAFDVADQNDKWRKELSADQQRILNDVLADALPAWGYALDRDEPQPRLRVAPEAAGSAA